MLDVEKMRSIRTMYRVSQTELGKEMGITKNRISQVENRAVSLTREFHDRYMGAIYNIVQNRDISQELKELSEEIEEVK